MYYLCMVGVMYLIMPLVVSASNVGIAVNRTAIVFDTNVDELHKFAVEVKNISNEKQIIDVGVMDYALGDDNIITILDKNDDNGIREWVKPESKNIVLESGDVKEVIFDVNIPKNASIGSHRGAVFFHVMSKNNNVVKVEGQIGVHVLINIKGDTHASGYINKFDIPFLTTGLVDYIVEFKNTGNIHYVPYGEVTVYNVFTRNKQLYKYDKHFVFPGKKFVFSHVKQIPSLFGLYKTNVAFVDGEGIIHAKSDYIMGYLFPLAVFVIVIGALVVFKQLFKVRKYMGKNKRQYMIHKIAVKKSRD